MCIPPPLRDLGGGGGNHINNTGWFFFFINHLAVVKARSIPNLPIKYFLHILQSLVVSGATQCPDFNFGRLMLLYIRPYVFLHNRQVWQNVFTGYLSGTPAFAPTAGRISFLECFLLFYPTWYAHMKWRISDEKNLAVFFNGPFFELIKKSTEIGLVSQTVLQNFHRHFLVY